MLGIGKLLLRELLEVLEDRGENLKNKLQGQKGALKLLLAS